jgi:class 3 adenylate cyclase
VGGEALTQLHQVEDLSRSNQIVVSSAARIAGGDGLLGHSVGVGALQLARVDAIPGLPRSIRTTTPDMLAAMRTFIPQAVQPAIGSGYQDWVAEIRAVTVLFVHLPEGPGAGWNQRVVRALQKALYRFEGSLNKLGTDTQGIVPLLAFGLPPLAHEQDPLWEVRTALAIRRDLALFGQSCSIGIASGRAFCGLVGTEERCEYTLIGDVVNLAARLAQVGQGQILVDRNTMRRCRGQAEFTSLAPIHVKGKRDPIPIFEPHSRQPGRQSNK